MLKWYPEKVRPEVTAQRAVSHRRQIVCHALSAEHDKRVAEVSILNFDRSSLLKHKMSVSRMI